MDVTIGVINHCDWGLVMVFSTAIGFHEGKRSRQSYCIFPTVIGTESDYCALTRGDMQSKF